MSDQESRQRALESLLRPLGDGRAELVVTYRRFEDYDAYEQEIQRLREQVKRLERDIYTWTMTGNQYLQALDEINRLKKILRRNHIEF